MRTVLIAMSRLHCVDGIASNLCTLMSALATKGWQPHLAAGIIDCPPESESRLRCLREASVTLTEVPELRFDGRQRVYSLARQFRSLKGLVTSVNADILHLRGRALGPAARAVRLIGGPPSVNVPPLSIDNQLQGTTTHLFAPIMGRLLGDRVVAISLEMKEHLRNDWGVPESLIRHVPHGVQLERFKQPSVAERHLARRQLGLSDEDFVVCQVARVCAIKQPATLVRSIAKLHADGFKAHAVLAGHADEAERRNVEQTAERLRISDYVHLVGYVDSRDVLYASDVSVLASEREGFGISVVEAMACGVVPVRTPTEGARDQIEAGVDGFIFQIGDDLALASHLKWLATHSQERRAMSSHAAQKAVEQFSDNAMAANMIAVYEELLCR